MKRVLALVLSVLLTYQCVLVVAAVPSNESLKKGYIKVEFSDLDGKAEYLNVAVKNGNVYVDAEQLATRLGYSITINDSGTKIYNPAMFGATGRLAFQESNLPFCFLIFNYSDTKVISFPTTWEYSAPFAAEKDGECVWIPLEYSLLMLNSSLLVVDDTLEISMPRKDVIDWLLSARVRADQDFEFDWTVDFGYSEGVQTTISAISRGINVFNGALKSDGPSWAQIFKDNPGALSAITGWNNDLKGNDTKYGKDFARLMVTESNKEYEKDVKRIKTLNDVISPNGKIGKLMDSISASDKEVGELQAECDKLLGSIRQGNSQLTTQYNRMYQQLENALGSDSWYSKVGSLISDAQDQLQEVSTMLKVFSIVGEVVGYMGEFSRQDTFGFESMIDLMGGMESSYVPPQMAEAINEELSMMSTDLASYSVYRYVDKNASGWIKKAMKVSDVLGSDANLALLIWDLASSYVPFISNGLKAAEKMELAIYSQAFQGDTQRKAKEEFDGVCSDKDVRVEELFRLAKEWYIYLKNCYVTRDVALGSLANLSDERKQAVVDWQKAINDDIAEYLSAIKEANSDNANYAYGFLPQDNVRYLEEYDGSNLAKIVKYDQGLLGEDSDKPDFSDLDQMLNSYYFENFIQSRKIYFFNSDGIVIEYDIDPFDPVTQESLHFSKEYHYEVTGDTLTLIYDDDQRTVLQLVSKESTSVDWDIGLQNQIRKIDEEYLFYEVGWKASKYSGWAADMTGTARNAVYLEVGGLKTDINQEPENNDDIEYDENHIVTDAYHNAFGGREYSIPRINLPGDDIAKINSEIFDNIYPKATEGLNWWETSGEEGSEKVAYSFAVNHGYLSLNIEYHPDNVAIVYYHVININLETKKPAPNEDIIISSEYTIDEYREKVKQAMGSCFWKEYGNNNKNFENEYFVESFNKCLDQTLSDENILEATPYYNLDGQLCVIARICSLAGADSYSVSLNLENFSALPYFNKHAEFISPDDIDIQASMFIGDWDVAVQTTNENNSQTLFNAFGTAGSRLDHYLRLKEDGTFSFAYQFWEGEGTWMLDKGGNEVNIVVWTGETLSNMRESGTLRYSAPYLEMDFDLGSEVYTIYWEKIDK